MQRIRPVVRGELVLLAIQCESAFGNAVPIASDNRAEVRMIAKIAIKRIEPKHHIRHLPERSGVFNETSDSSVIHDGGFHPIRIGQGVKIHCGSRASLTEGAFVDLGWRLREWQQRPRPSVGWHGGVYVTWFFYPKTIYATGRDLSCGARRLGRACAPTVRYWMETEVHVYGFSIAANVLLSFFPFLIVMMSLCRHVLHWPEAVDAIMLALRDYFPAEMGAFLETESTIYSEFPRTHAVWLDSVAFFTANGVFEPLEVALNRAWGITKNRSFLKNQIVSMGLIFLCGGLVLLSIVFTAANQQALEQFFGAIDAGRRIWETFSSEAPRSRSRC